MTDQDAKENVKYESPIVVPLGEMAKGLGYCAAGPSADPGYCTAGNSAASACTAGIVARAAACTAGTHPGA